MGIARETTAVFDTHAHLNDKAFVDDVGQAVARAAENGVFRIVVPGFDMESSRRAVELAGSHPGVYAAVGVTPHEAATVADDEAYLDELNRLAANPRVVAIGEIGLDYHYDFSPRDVQKRVFSAQLELACRTGKPVIVHDREAHEDTMDALFGARLPVPARGVLHCFSGSRQMARDVVAHGFYLGVAGPITFANAKKPVEVFRETPLDNLVVETDSPYLAPVPLRGKRNEPAFVTWVVRTLAQVRELEAGEVARVTTANALRLFGLGGDHDKG